MKSLIGILRKVSIVLWVGGLWAIGYLVAPILFSSLSENRALAGTLAGKMFKGIGWVGISCGAFLLLQQLYSIRSTALKQSVFWLVLSMLVITLILQFWIQPAMSILRTSGVPISMIGIPAFKSFAFWHGVSSTLFLLQSVLGLMLILKDRKAN